MNDIFGRVVTLLIAASVLFGSQVISMQERSKSACQMYLLAECTRFVDNVCNTGFLSRNMMQQFYKDMAPVQGICDIKLMHETKELVYVAKRDAFEQVSTYRDEEDISRQLEKGEHYLFARNDFLRVTVCVDGGMCVLPWLEDETENVTYGGVIKYEAY